MLPSDTMLAGGCGNVGTSNRPKSAEATRYVDVSDCNCVTASLCAAVTWARAASRAAAGSLQSTAGRSMYCGVSISALATSAGSTFGIRDFVSASCRETWPT
jgi:hypothetical protein